MKTSHITSKDGKQCISAAHALESISDLLQFAGIKETVPTDYITFITLQKSILLRPGKELYAIWIKNTYNKEDKKVWEISLQTDHSLSMSIKQFILEAVESGTLLLTEEMDCKIAIAS